MSEAKGTRSAGVLAKRLKDAAGSGPLPTGISAETAASLVQTMIQGLAVQAKSGSSRSELRDVCRAFLGIWPPVRAAPAIPSDANSRPTDVAGRSSFDAINPG
jgi:hypothetical protein